MAKRFTATEKWERPWFRALPDKYKLLWIYLCDKCDISGVWYVDIEMASFAIGHKLTIHDTLKVLGKQVKVINGGSKWLVVDFVSFQYGTLSEKSRFHNSISTKLKEHIETPCPQAVDTLSTPCPEPVDRPKVKVEVKDKVKEDLFIRLWDKYPKKLGKEDAKRHFDNSVKTAVDEQDIEKALDNYLSHPPSDPKYFQNGSTWFHKWREWAIYVPPAGVEDQKAKFAEIMRLNRGGV
jgi:hypothetical protein